MYYLSFFWKSYLAIKLKDDSAWEIMRKCRDKEVNVIETRASHVNRLEADEKEEEKIRQEGEEPREIQLEKADEEEASTQFEADGDNPLVAGVGNALVLAEEDVDKSS